jgi:dTDP-glucose 4,6-dehydratase
MRIGITGEKGFIAKNLSKAIEAQGHEFVSLDNSEYANNNMWNTDTGEVCVYSNNSASWSKLFNNLDIDVIIHNAAIVGTDVVALNPEEAINTNVLGTKTITSAANASNIMNVYIGTTVIYDTYKYQESEITEVSKIYPRTDYAIQKYAGEMIVRNNADNWLVARPLFAYGGIGDMNSLISKSLYAIKNKIKNVDMFLDPEKIKDYMHVEDFCFGVMTLINSNIINEDFNITAANPYSTLEIVNMIEEVSGQSLDEYIKWYPETDYLGNHRLSNEKFQKFVGFTKTRFLKEGISQAWKSINSLDDSSMYNPLKYLNEAKEKDIDLKAFFPK